MGKIRKKAWKWQKQQGNKYYSRMSNEHGMEIVAGKYENKQNEHDNSRRKAWKWQKQNDNSIRELWKQKQHGSPKQNMICRLRKHGRRN